MKRWIMAAGLMVLPTSAQAMSVADFLAKMNAIKAQGLLAAVSPDLKLIGAELKQVGETYRTDIDGARRAGRTPDSCPPPPPQKKLSSQKAIAEFGKIVASFEAIPAAQRGISVKDAFYAMMRERFPCN